MFAKIIASTGLLAAANAHILMAEPKAWTSGWDLQNAPLEASGSNFPCKLTGTPGGPTNQYELGSKQSMSFTGSAVHGGGSCQISISKDTVPTKSSVWKVIHSIEGGCPARNTEGNYASDPTFADPNEYEYTIPSDIAAGEYTIAWTWLNRVGNREFYMNCGSLQLSGTSTADNFDKLPDLAVANLADVNSCSTESDLTYLYASPGGSVEKNLGNLFGASTTQLAATCTVAGSGSGSGSGGGAATSAAVALTTTAAAPTPTGAFIESSATAVPAASTPEPSPAAPAAPAATAGSGSSSGSSSGGLTGACSTEGEYNCIADSSFQMCASGQWSAVMQMAAGVKCTAGQSTSLAMVAGRVRRGVQARSFRA